MEQKDVWLNIIFPYLDIDSRRNLSSTCKFLREIYIEFYKKKWSGFEVIGMVMAAKMNDKDLIYL